MLGMQKNRLLNPEPNGSDKWQPVDVMAKNPVTMVKANESHNSNW